MRTSENKETELKRRGDPQPSSRIELEFLGLEVETLYDCITDIPHPSRLRKMRRTQNRSFLTKLLKDAFTSSTNTQKLFSRSVSNQHQVKVLNANHRQSDGWETTPLAVVSLILGRDSLKITNELPVVAALDR